MIMRVLEVYFLCLCFEPCFEIFHPHKRKKACNQQLTGVCKVVYVRLSICYSSFPLYCPPYTECKHTGSLSITQTFDFQFYSDLNKNKGHWSGTKTTKTKFMVIPVIPCFVKIKTVAANEFSINLTRFSKTGILTVCVSHV